MSYSRNRSAFAMLNYNMYCDPGVYLIQHAVYDSTNWQKIETKKQRKELGL